ncbi:cyclopropane-fatty-acyl-phospholipid synthase family protein [Parafrankia sp. EUN1f]|uniref:SAM-dependent methyltransferase n=1 Tax=Parafrankia sp. EUN1f TaxID=102897 RepID=UPI0001C466FF|nr:cyclopropane-fatty-acyl-phospholipid synthase family protein [Parafrankia sp. EUN1f]EFC83523.1 Cyclopropane-fatty-acyl-phospholipid synthase [Parafrankia sp. EUN1f]
MTAPASERQTADRDGFEPDGSGPDRPGPEARGTNDALAAAAAAVRYHYDVGNEFYRLWLDTSLSYSCAMPDGPDDDLEAAQDRKLRFHLDAVNAQRAGAVLDIGCGWGAVLGRLALTHRVPRAVGLTLSIEQAAHVAAAGHPGVEVRTEDWRDYEPDELFDGIISIGAFEHFARPQDSSAEKIQTYRDFFERARSWLTADGALSLQTIAYANMPREQASAFMQQEIFPDADLPTLAEITTAAEGVLETRLIRNDRLDYAWTCEQWARRLRARRDEATGFVGPDIVARYERYLRMSALGFRSGKICLYRLVFTPYPRGYAGRATPAPASGDVKATAR